MISWKEYIKDNILEFRRVLKTYPKESVYSLGKPSQVVLIDFDEPFPKCFIILHSEQYPDMETLIFENEVPEDFFSKISREKPKWLELLGIGKIEDIHRAVEQMPQLAWMGDWSAQIVDKSILILRRGDPRSDKYFLSDLAQILIDVEHEPEESRKKIEETVGDIKRDAEAIPVEEVRTKIVEATERLEKQIEPLYEKYKKLESDVVGVRRLVGTRGFGEWKVLLSEMDKMNTRIDALSEIRSAYDKILAQQTEFIKQQSEVMKQQSSFIKWIKYATILLPIAVISVPVIEIISIVIRHFLDIP